MRITNNGSKIVTTDYWQSEHAKAGLAYCSVNGGGVRLLIPAGFPDDLHAAARAAKTATVGLASALHAARITVALFDGPPDDPYVIEIDKRMCDRVLPAAEAGRKVPLRLYGPKTGAADGVELIASLTCEITLAR